MVVLNRIYTKTGDKGETALGDGTRLPKHALRISAFGTVDEANAAIGLVRLHTSGELDAMLARIQNDLFDLGADLCVPEQEREDRQSTRERTRLRVTPEQVAFYVDLMKKVQATPEWKEYVERTSQTNVFLTGDAFAKFMAEDIEHVRKVAADQGWLVAN